MKEREIRTFEEQGLKGKTGERVLAIDVYEYVLDQGVEFYVEPSSARGK